jgi:hypothetical protein
MSTIIQQPDALSFSGNLQKFIVSSEEQISFQLQFDGTTILDEVYQPDSEAEIIIDIRTVVERLLQIWIPTDSSTLTEQSSGAGDFVAIIDGTEIEFRVIKGGVAELSQTAESWLPEHFLTWQPQAKRILQTQPEWLGIYPMAVGNIRVTTYFADGSSSTFNYAELDAHHLYLINTSWGNIADGGQPIAWDVWFEVDGTRMTPVQRYQLRNAGDQEHVYVWANTLGGVDSVSFTGAREDDEMLEHKNAEYFDQTISEYDIDKARQIRQSTGYLTTEEGFWLKDFFYSRKKYLVRDDGSQRQIAVVSSRIISVSQDDQHDYEFTLRMSADYQLLNLDRAYDSLPAPEGLADFFLTELLSGLTEASYADNLILAVQSPFAVGWQKLSMAQLWGGALPGLVDNATIKFVNGKLTAIGIGVVLFEAVEFTDTNTPSIENYDQDYAPSFGQFPSVTLHTYDEESNRIERSERPRFILVDGRIDRITFDISPKDNGEPQSGIIILK